MALTVYVNDEPLTLDAPCSVAQLLQQRGLGEAACAVEINRTLIPKRQHAERQLAHGDRIEIVTLVGGG